PSIRAPATASPAAARCISAPSGSRAISSASAARTASTVCARRMGSHPVDLGQGDVDVEGDGQLEPLPVDAVGHVGLGGGVEFVDVDDGGAVLLLHPPEVLDPGFGVELRFPLPVTL